MVTSVTVPTRPLTASHPVHWFAPQPLWRVLPRDADFTTRRGQPAILRFASDSFMDDLLALLGTAPLGDLAAYVAQPESWREPLVGLKDGRDRSQELLKLYQPAHNRFYLVAGALACAVPGVPDRMIEPNQGESAFFVIRRRRPKPGTSGQTLEDAWSTGMQLCADAPAKGWVELADADHELLCNEERLPLFPISFQQDGVTRRRLAGLVPVASREAAAAAAPSAAERAKPGGDPRPILFEQQITGVVQSLREWYIRLPKDSAGKPASDVDQRQLKRTTAFMLLDLMAQLRDHVRPLYDAINGGTLVTSGPAKPLSDLIGGTTASGTRLSEVMRAIEQDRAQIEALEADDPLKSSWEFPWSGWDGNFAAWMAPLESATLTIPQPGGGQRTETVHGPAVQVRFARALAQPFVPSGPRRPTRRCRAGTLRGARSTSHGWSTTGPAVARRRSACPRGRSRWRRSSTRTRRCGRCALRCRSILPPRGCASTTRAWRLCSRTSCGRRWPAWAD